MDGKRYPQQLFKRGLLYARRGKHGNGYSHECSGLLWRLDFLPEQLRQWGPHECNHSRTQSGALFSVDIGARRICGYVADFSPNPACPKKHAV